LDECYKVLSLIQIKLQITLYSTDPTICCDETNEFSWKAGINTHNIGSD